MKISHLCSYAQKREASLEQFDKKLFPLQRLLSEPLFSDRPEQVSSCLRRVSSKPEVLFEVKKASPTLGSITSRGAVELCHDFVESGAKAISVLVDPVNFGGHPQDLIDAVKSFSALPFLWKDFVVSEYQVRLAKHCGASAVLLMTQLLEDDVLKDLFQLCQAIGIEAFVETHRQAELEFALELGASFIGINARDFSTPGLPVDLTTASKLLNRLGKDLPSECVLVAQSGIATVEDLNAVLSNMPAGRPDAVQIGSSVSSKAGLNVNLRAALELPV